MNKHHHHFPPPPTLTFAIPSLHEQTELECRLYVPDGAPSQSQSQSSHRRRQPHQPDAHALAGRHRPSSFEATPESHRARWDDEEVGDRSQTMQQAQAQTHAQIEKEAASLTRAALLAHPYAKLGGSFDDPAILAATAELLRQGYLVATFNFRGAGNSKGSTSWTGLPELADYVSVVGFLLHFLNELGESDEDGDGSDSRVSSSSSSSPSTIDGPASSSSAAAAAAVTSVPAPGRADSNSNSNSNNDGATWTTKSVATTKNADEASIDSISRQGTTAAAIDTTKPDAAAAAAAAAADTAATATTKTPQQAPLQRQRRISLLLGGYSYGARILAHIPSVSAIVTRFFSSSSSSSSSSSVTSTSTGARTSLPPPSGSKSPECLIRDVAVEMAARARARARARVRARARSRQRTGRSSGGSVPSYSSPSSDAAVDAVTAADARGGGTGGDVADPSAFVRAEHSVQLGGSEQEMESSRRRRTLSSPKQIGNAIRRSVEVAATGGRRRISTAVADADADANTFDANTITTTTSQSHSQPTTLPTQIRLQQLIIDLRFLLISPVLGPAGWLTSPRLHRPPPLPFSPSSSSPYIPGGTIEPTTAAPSQMKVAGAEMRITDVWADYPSLVLHGVADQFSGGGWVRDWVEAQLRVGRGGERERGMLRVSVRVFWEAEGDGREQDHFWYSRESGERLVRALGRWVRDSDGGRRLLV